MLNVLSMYIINQTHSFIKCPLCHSDFIEFWLCMLTVQCKMRSGEATIGFMSWRERNEIHQRDGPHSIGTRIDEGSQTPIGEMGRTLSGPQWMVPTKQNVQHIVVTAIG